MPGEVDRNHASVTAFLTQLLEVGNVYCVEDKGYVLSCATDEVIQLKIGEVQRPLMVYKYGMDDNTAIVICPFSEGVVETIERNWFYGNLNLITAGVVRKCLRLIITKALEQKKTKTDAPEPAEDLASIKLFAPFIPQVDEKLLVELDKITDSKMTDLLSIAYRRSKKHAKVVSMLLDPKYREIHQSVRKKSWGILQAMLLHVLQVDSVEALDLRYTTVPTEQGCPKFDAYIKCWFAIWEALRDYLPYLGLSVPYHELEEHIRAITHYHQLTRWFRQPSTVEPDKPQAASGMIATGNTIAVTDPNKPWKPVASSPNKPWSQGGGGTIAVGGGMIAVGSTSGFGIGGSASNKPWRTW